MTKKKSFFERLTGIIKVDDENSDQEIAEHLEEELDEMESETEGQLAVDMYQTPSEIVLKTMVAGVKPEDLDIAITRDMITIKGKREEARDFSDDDFFHRELYWGSFSRTIILPQEVEVEDAEAINKNGLLTIRLPKLDKNRQAKLKVKSM
ncbi:MAG: Hsp20/alpha crystallin family protein [Candidatus Taylorbacteria bacterium]|nr:Hsp20/alpha crystallin family protein [Candidatus Taylorbacteria bacterium]